MSEEEEATEITEKYSKYFEVDTEKPKKKLDDAVEVLLSQLEEFCATLEIMRQHAMVCEPFLVKLKEKHNQLQVLYRQIDVFDNYLQDTMKTLDDLEMQLARGNKFTQLFSKIPGLSSVLNHIPRVSLLNFGFSNTGSSCEKS